MSLRLVADIGGTNARFALSRSPRDLTHQKQLQTANFANFNDALSAYLKTCGPELAGKIGSARIAAAGPFTGDEIKLTNADWLLQRSAIAEQLGTDDVVIVNDVEAVGHLLPMLDATDLSFASGFPGVFRPATRIVLNIGTGLGCATAHRSRRGSWFISGSEAGHIAFGAADVREAELLEIAATLEDILSGRGVVRLYRFLGGGRGSSGSPAQPDAAAQVFASAPHDPVAAETVAHLDRIIGRVLGDLVLAQAAWGGAALCGSVATSWFAQMDPGRFRSAFTQKGPMTARMLDCPVALMRLPDPGLICLTYMK